MRSKLIWTLVVAVILMATGGQPAWALTGVPPLPGPVVRGFDPPAADWLPGHRGVDLSGESGMAVVASAAGTVTFANILAGRGVVVVDHGELRTTYEPITALVSVGDQVVSGQVIGQLDAGHAECRLGTCLHWGARRGEVYVNPLSLLAQPQLRLLPQNVVALAHDAAATRTKVLTSTNQSLGLLSSPTPGQITSEYGLRQHPILQKMRPHQGIDIGAPCAAPIQAAAPGKVSSVSFGDETGNQLVIDHGIVGGHRLRTYYLHAEEYSVHRGDKVERGQAVGLVGSTGLSTGCHLHFAVTVDDEYVEPSRLLGR